MNMNMKLNTIYGNWTTRGYANLRISNSRASRGLINSWTTDNLRTSQLADWTSRGMDNTRTRRCRQKSEN